MSWQRATAAAMLAMLAGCNVSQHRHTFELVAGRDRQRLHVWMQPSDTGPRSLWIDTLFFPLDFLASTWTCTQAIWNDEVAVTFGPLGWLATALPFCSANWYGDIDDVPMPIRPFAPEAQPFRVVVQPQDLLALRSADHNGARVAAFDRAVMAALPPRQSARSGRRWLLDQRFWQDSIRPALTAVELVAPAPPGR